MSSLYLFNLRRFLTQQFQQVNIIILNVILTITQKAMQYRIYLLKLQFLQAKEQVTNEQQIKQDKQMFDFLHETWSNNGGKT